MLLKNFLKSKLTRSKKINSAFLLLFIIFKKHYHNTLIISNEGYFNFFLIFSIRHVSN